MRIRFRVFGFIVITSLIGPSDAEEGANDYARSQAVFAAIDACKSDRCNLRDYLSSVKEREGEIEVVFVGRSAESAESLFSGRYEDVIERHFFFDATGTKLLRRGYGK